MLKLQHKEFLIWAYLAKESMILKKVMSSG